MRNRIWIVASLLLFLVGCSNDGTAPNLATFNPKGKPDELAIVVYDKIEKPEQLADLTPPKQFVNRVELTPVDDALNLLGGSKQRRDDAIPASDNQLVAHVSRLGVDPDIRTTLAVEDLQFRSENRGRPLEILARVNLYFKAYEPFSLDPELEEIRLQQVGIVQ